MQAEYISLVDNQFIKSLSDLVAKETKGVHGSVQVRFVPNPRLTR